MSGTEKAFIWRLIRSFRPVVLTAALLLTCALAAFPVYAGEDMEQEAVTEAETEGERSAIREDGLLDPELAVEEDYVENQWNYVDGSMYITDGIPDNAPGILGKIRSAGKLRVATEPYFPPQEFIDPDGEGQESYVGSDMELARLIADRMGVELEIIPMDFTDVLTAVMHRECDLAISGLAFTPMRAAGMELSKGYHFSDTPVGAELLIREGDLIFSADDLAGRDLVAQQGSLQEMLMAEHVKNYRQFRRVTTMQEVYDAVESCACDVAAVDGSSARLYIASNPGCGLALVEGVAFTVEPQYDGDRVAAPKGELALIYFVNVVIDEVLRDGTYEAWFEAYAKKAEELGL